MGRVESRTVRAEMEVKMNHKIDYTNPIELASLGWKVFPCHSVDDDGLCTCGDPHKEDANRIGKHPRITDWPLESTADHSQIRKWLEMYSQVNWAIVCRTSGMVVFDVDPRNGGTAGLVALKEALGKSWTPTFTVATGVYDTNENSERGLHLYYKAPAKSEFSANLGDAFPGIDVKYNGYVMAPGSRHKSGVRYEVVEPLDVANIPQELSSRVPKRRAKVVSNNPVGAAPAESASPYGAAALEDESRKVQYASEGTRNTQLFKSGIAVGQLIAGGELPLGSVDQLVESAKNAGLGKSEIEQTLLRVDGAIARGVAEPRVAPSKSYESVFERTAEIEGEELVELLSRAGRVDWVEAFKTDWEQEWFIPGFVAAQRGHSLYSDAGTGKSAIIRQACAELATQRVVLGTKAFSRPLVVLYFDHENSVLGDVVPHLRPLGFQPEELGNLVFLSFPNIAELDTKQGGIELEHLLDHYNPELVILDTVSRTISQDENLNKTWLDFYRFAGAKLKAREIAYIRLDHTGKNQARGQRGGSAKKGDLDLVWHLSKGSKDRLVLKCEKNRLPIDAVHLGVNRHENPFSHNLSVTSGSPDWSALIRKVERWNQMLDFIRGHIEGPDGLVGSNALWEKHKQFFQDSKWPKSEVTQAHKTVKAEILGIEPEVEAEDL
jgi:hypothetical protein